MFVTVTEAKGEDRFTRQELLKRGTVVLIISAATPADPYTFNRTARPVVEMVLFV